MSSITRVHGFTPRFGELPKSVEYQDQELSFLVSAHFHPYVEQLRKRLATQSLRGLFDADNEYKVEDATARRPSVPGSILIDVTGRLAIELPLNSRLVLGEIVSINTPGREFLLPLNLACRLKVAPILVNVNDPSQEVGHPPSLVRFRVPTLDSAGQPRPIGLAPHAPEFAIVAGEKLVLVENTALVLSSNAKVQLGNGPVVDLPLGTKVTILAGSEVSVPNPPTADVTIRVTAYQPLPELSEDLFGVGRPYLPNPEVVREPYARNELDFSITGSYSVYNWELFFHVPMAIAIHLSRNQRFADAQEWFHWIFDPGDDSAGPDEERYWKFRPFQHSDAKSVEQIMLNLSSKTDTALARETIVAIQAWMESPFRPHLVARLRQSPYMLKTITAYLDNLIAWGDSLFLQDTGESINEATQLYVTAANILGPRAQLIPKKGTKAPRSYRDLRANLDEFSNAKVEMESVFPFDKYPSKHTSSDAQSRVIQSIGEGLYFCIPRNQKLLDYWDVVADRLFKIRNSLNLQGVFRQLPLFEPRIDPALLVAATAAGVEVSAVLAGLDQPLPLVRFQLLAQKAIEFCQELKSLGANLLAAIEKEDNEALSVLRASHEHAILGMTEAVKVAQIHETQKMRESLEQSLTTAKYRYSYYARLLGQQEEIKFDDFAALTAADVPNEAAVISEPITPVLVDVAVDNSANLGDTGGRQLNRNEAEDFQKSADSAQIHDDVQIGKLSAQLLGLLPNFGFDIHFWGLGGHAEIGGVNLGPAASFIADAATAFAESLTHDAVQASKIGSYSRREQEWAYQRSLAAGEILQIYKQIRAAQIREAVAKIELDNHRKQMEQSVAIQAFLDGESTAVGKNGMYTKTSTQGFYAYLSRELRTLYNDCYRFAFTLAKKAERALQFELGDPSLSYVKASYLSGREGLLAGEKLHSDVRSMETAFLDLNRREYELTKHVSLLQVDPLKLIDLRATGRCVFSVPEEQFDFDGPGHYFRRIKSVAVSIPSVVGPYISVNCTLTQLGNRIRTRATPSIPYEHSSENDERFRGFRGSTQSIVTSSAQNDSGLFETNFRDERYLPFEGTGAISEWQLQLPGGGESDVSKSVRQFDYSTISDVFLQIRYTAREGGETLRKAAASSLIKRIELGEAAGVRRLFSIRHEFPASWAKFQFQTAVMKNLSFEIIAAHYPFWLQRGKKITAEILIEGGNASAVKCPPDSADKSALSLDDPITGWKRTTLSTTGPAEGLWSIALDANDMKNIYLAISRHS